MIRGTWLEPLVWWAFAAIAVTGLCGVAFIVAQQSFRQSLNDPQIQIAEDAVRAIASGAALDTVVPRGPAVDVATSDGAWIAVYDGTRKPLLSSGMLNGAAPQPPAGTFDPATWTLAKSFAAAAGRETRFSWQPSPDVRQAVVLIKLDLPVGDAAYVAAGRNMRGIEARIITVGQLILLAWLAILAALLAASFVGWRPLRAPDSRLELSGRQSVS